MKTILIIKEEFNDFEKFFSKKMKTDDVDVYAPYKREKTKFMRYIRAICKKTRILFFVWPWLNRWKEDLKKYKVIIIFDNCATVLLLKMIYKINPQANVKIWLWNIPQNPIEELKKYAEIITFDKKYAKENNIGYMNQFYPTTIKSNLKELKWDVLFVGADKGRYEQVRKIARELRSNKKSYFFYIYKKEQKAEIEDDLGIIIGNRMMDYTELLDKIFESKTVLEINIDSQVGLTLRTMESLFFEKKLITNNKALKDYDFYRKNNIYILDNKEENSIIEFLDSSYSQVDKDIVKKYSYERWIKKWYSK